MNTFNATFRRMAETIFQPRPKEEVWEWADRNVKIPEIVGSLNPGQVNTGRLRFWRLVWQLYWRKRTRFITIQGSARVGKTFFALVCVLHKIATWSGPIGWLDATRFTARRFARSEFQPHVDDCEPAARLAIKDRTHWTLSEMFFEGSKLNMLGAGSPSDTTGFQAELVVINESNKCKHDVKSEAGIHDIMIGRSKHFWRTRKIVEVSTPTDNYGRITTRWKDGTQHAAYFPCPTCHKMQRMTFFPEEKEVPWDDSTEFDAYGFPIGDPVTSVEKTMSVGFAHCRRPEDEKQYDTEKVEREASYLCGYCEALAPAHKLNWMMRRVTLRAHNIKAPDDHISFHAWTGMSPFEHIGTLANKFLAARGNIGKMHSFWNDELGLPFVRHATEIKETDLDVIIKMSPDYALKTLPRKPVIMTMAVDVQGSCFWWSIRAWGIIEEMPEAPMWSALVDYGSAVAWDQIEELAGIKSNPDGTWNEYLFNGESFRVQAGLVDSGFEAQANKKVYEFCLRNQHVFSPSKGGGWMQLRGMTIRTTPVYDDKLELLIYEDASLKQQLYYHCIKERKEQWWLPRDICRIYRAQMVAEHTEERKQHDGSLKLEWVVSGPDGNHLADTEKMHEALRPILEPRLMEIREEILAARK
jgi:phage terminase large subunit GpA-like protein